METARRSSEAQATHLLAAMAAGLGAALAPALEVPGPARHWPAAPWEPKTFSDRSSGNSRCTKRQRRKRKLRARRLMAKLSRLKNRRKRA